MFTRWEDHQKKENPTLSIVHYVLSQHQHRKIHNELFKACNIVIICELIFKIFFLYLQKEIRSFCILKHFCDHYQN